MHINEYGSREDPTIILQYMPLSVKPTIRKGYARCEYMAAYPEEYAQETERFITEIS